MQKAEKNFSFIFTVGFLAYASIYIARLNFAVASAAFESGGLLNKAQIGIIGSMFAIWAAASAVSTAVMCFNSRRYRHN